MVAVVREESTAYSARFTLPRRSMQEWARILACRVVDGVLAAATTTAQMRDEFDISALALPEAAQRTCEAILCKRCVIGDKRINSWHDEGEEARECLLSIWVRDSKRGKAALYMVPCYVSVQ